jgi:serine/threonine protein kinase
MMTIYNAFTALFVKENMYLPPFIGAAQYRAPEVILGDKWSKPIDIWALGCLVRPSTPHCVLLLTFVQAFELLAGRELYALRTNEMDKQHVALLTQTVDMFGSEVFSPEFLSWCKRAETYTKVDGKDLDGRLWEVMSKTRNTGPLGVSRPAKTSIHEGLRELIEWNRKANAPSMVGRLWNMFSSAPSKDDAILYDEAELLRASCFITRCLTVDPTLRPTAAELLKDEWIANADMGTDV